ncbi:hypothetical protein ILUMI_04291 [Ignelater luminosus]|uniref:Pre-rRNA-processing protein TSR2 homolog n=1 Tax=Ignelater luminosus TaxID=2038154 RepID=A0A8K0GEP7_IGNLU|nr:hypothetical protein ILUMI_04291 [Ignelater luminosus]
MEEKFRPIVEHIFNNWTALQLAVEHSMGGPNSRNLAVDFVDEIARYCVEEANVDVSDIQDELEGVMDEWFDTLCEDNSPAEIANLLFRFLSLLRDGNTAQCELEYQNLPTCKLWLSKPQPAPKSEATCSNNSQEQDSTDVPMEEDSEWTEVKSRKRR